MDISHYSADETQPWREYYPRQGIALHWSVAEQPILKPAVINGYFKQSERHIDRNR